MHIKYSWTMSLSQDRPSQMHVISPSLPLYYVYPFHLPRDRVFCRRSQKIVFFQNTRTWRLTKPNKLLLSWLLLYCGGWSWWVGWWSQLLVDHEEEKFSTLRCNGCRWNWHFGILLLLCGWLPLQFWFYNLFLYRESAAEEHFRELIGTQV